MRLSEIILVRWRGIVGPIIGIVIGFAKLTSYLIGLGLPTDEKNTSNDYWRVMISITGILCFIDLIIYLIIIRFDTATFYMNRAVKHLFLYQEYLEKLHVYLFYQINSFENYEYYLIN